jgi:hypothetical protein
LWAFAAWYRFMSLLWLSKVWDAMVLLYLRKCSFVGTIIYHTTMTITVHSTNKICQLVTGTGAIECRVWEGQTERGIPVHCFIPRIAAKLDADLTQFEAELQSCATPTAEIAAFPLRLIL